MVVLFISRAEINNASAMTSYFTAGAPGPVAFCGFGHNMARELGLLKNYMGIAPIHHHFEMMAEGSYPHNFSAAGLSDLRDHAKATEQKYERLAGQPAARCRLIMSFALVFAERASISQSRVAALVQRLRVGGGNVVNEPRIRKYGSLAEALQYRRGFGLHLRTDLVDPKNPLAVLEKLHPAVDPSWLSLNCVGYKQITALSTERQSRENYPHAYVEPLVTAMQYVSMNTAQPPVWDFAPHNEGDTEYRVHIVENDAEDEGYF